MSATAGLLLQRFVKHNETIKAFSQMGTILPAPVTEKKARWNTEVFVLNILKAFNKFQVYKILRCECWEGGSQVAQPRNPV